MVDYLFEVFLTLSGWNDFLCFPSCFWRCNWSSDLGLHFDCKRLKHCDLPIRIYWVLRYSTVSLLHPRFFLQICCSRNGRVHPLSFWHYRCLVFLYLKTPRITPFLWSANVLLFFLSLTLGGFEMQLFWGVVSRKHFKNASIISLFTLIVFFRVQNPIFFTLDLVFVPVH